MKQFYVKLFVCLVFVSGIFTNVHAQFSGAFAPSNWTISSNNSNGSIITTGAPNQYVLVSSDGLSGAGWHDINIIIPQAGIITFNWTYTTADSGPNWDYPQYLVNNTAFMMTGYSTSGSTSQSGSQACITVTPGQLFGFRVYSVDNFGGPCTTTISAFSFITSTVSISPASPSVCPGQTIALTASGGSNLSWSGGIQNGVPFTPTAPTVYTVTSGTGGCITTKTVLVDYHAPIAIVGPTSNICANTTVTLTATGGSGFTWNTGSTNPSISVSPSNTTIYSVVGTTTAGCNSTTAKTVTVDPGVPSLTIVSSNGTSGVCPGKTLSLTGTGATSYAWTGGITNNTSFTIASSTNYTLTGTNSCGSSTAAISVSIHPLPTISTVVSTPSICSSQSVAFTAVGNATNYVWTGGITNGSAFYPSVNTTNTVVGTSAQGCTVQATAFVSVVTTPVSQPLSNPPLICVGSSATLSAPGASSYSWTTPTGVVNTTSIVVSPPATTTYTLSKSNANCVNTQTVQVLVNNLPSVQAFATPPVVCAGKPSVLQGGGALTFTWTAPGFTQTGASPTVNPVNSTTYIVTASDGTCINTASTSIVANPNPVITIAPSSTAICVGQSVTLNASGALTYTWTTNTGTMTAYPSGTAVTGSVQDSPDQHTLYSITGVNTHTCFSSTSQVVIVNPVPVLNIQTLKPLVCSGAVSSLTVTGANTYLWDANAGNATTSITPVTPASTTVYSVTGTYTATGCNSTKTIQVAVFEPTFAVNTPTSSCLGGTITLVASGAKSYVWQTPPQNQPFASIQVAPTTPTFYVVTAISASNGVDCASTRTVDVDIYANPTITAVTNKTLVCKGEPAILTGGGGVSFTWTPPSQNGTTVTVNPAFSTTYNVVGIDQNGCVGTSSVAVKISTCYGLDELDGKTVGLKLYPNPNNGQFTLYSEKDLTMDLLNSIGQHVRSFTLRAHESQKINVGHLPAGVYFLAGSYQGEKFAQKIIINE